MTNKGFHDLKSTGKTSIGENLKIRRKIKLVVSIIIISVFSFIIFYPSIDNDFTNWDDPVYVTLDTMIFDMKYDNLVKIFKTPVSFNYHPLTMISLAINYRSAFNKDTKILSARDFHITNLILHILNTILVFFFIYLLTGKNIPVAFIVSLLSGIHPLRVESVAWVSERKDVLYGFFYLASMIAYQKYLSHRSFKYYFLILLFFLCSVLSKATAITLPLILFVIDYYYRRKFSKYSILEKVPFLIISIIFGIVAVKIQSAGGALTSLFNLTGKISIASYGFFMYLYKLFLPLNLSTYYPYPFPVNYAVVNVPAWIYLFPALAFLLILILFFTRKYSVIPVFGILFYFITISIVLQFISVGTVIIADRYTYIPYIGIFFIVGSFYNYLNNKCRKANGKIVYYYLKLSFILCLAIYVLICSFLTSERIKIWKNSETLWTDVINKYPGQSEIANLNRGYYYYLKELETNNTEFIDKSIEDYKVLVRMKSKNPFVYSIMGNLLVLKNQPSEAIEFYNKSAQLDSTNSGTLINRSLTYIKIKKYELSLGDIEKVLQKYKTRQAFVLQAYDYYMLGDYTKSEDLYSNLIKNYPGYYDGYYYRGISYYKLKKFDESSKDLKIYLNFSNQKQDALYYISEIDSIYRNKKKQ